MNNLHVFFKLLKIMQGHYVNIIFFIYKAQFSAYLHNNDDKVSTVYIDLHQLLMLNNKKSKLRFIFFEILYSSKITTNFV